MDFGAGMGNGMMTPMEEPMPNEGPEGMAQPEDSGEEAELDPKKEIQKMTGELSQKLRLYNDENSDPELSKYVAGMIAVQAGKNLSGKDKKDIVKKLNGSEEEMEDMAMNGENQDSDQNENQPQPQMEGYIREIVNNVLSNDERKTRRPSKEIKNKRINGNNPFVYEI